MSVLYRVDGYDTCLRDAAKDLRHHRRTFVYKEEIVEELKKKFKDLEVRKEDFYWVLKRKEKKNGRI